MIEAHDRPKLVNFVRSRIGSENQTAPLDIDFRNNQWVYTNAALVSINGRPATLHKSCHLALEAENEQE
jgi:hypothetical protein